MAGLRSTDLSDEMRAFVTGADTLSENVKEHTTNNTDNFTAKSTADLQQESKVKYKENREGSGKRKKSSSGIFDDLTVKQETKRFTVDLEPELAQRFSRLAKKYKMPKAKFLRAIMERAFDDMEA